MLENKLSRRQFVGGVAVTAAATAAATAVPFVAGVSTAAAAPATVSLKSLQTAFTAHRTSGWTPLDPVRARRTAYEIYRGKYNGGYSTYFPAGTYAQTGQEGCSEGSWWPVIEQLGERVALQGQWDQIPKGLWMYGGGGINKIAGAVCGFYNGPMAILQFCAAPNNVMQDFHRWYEDSYVPSNACYVDYVSGAWTPAAGWGVYSGSGQGGTPPTVVIPLNNAPKVKPMTTTCHGSHTRWKAASTSWLQAKGASANYDRCGKGTADAAYKLATLINAWVAGATITGALDPTVGSTSAGCKQGACHASGGYPETGVGGIMKCTPCHTNRIGDGHNL